VEPKTVGQDQTPRDGGTVQPVPAERVEQAGGGRAGASPFGLYHRLPGPGGSPSACRIQARVASVCVSPSCRHSGSPIWSSRRADQPDTIGQVIGIAT